MGSSALREVHQNGEVFLETLTETPAAPGRPHPLLFVHGGWHGAWCWAEHFLPWFAARGYVACALSLRGHSRDDGMEEADHGIGDYVEDVRFVASVLEARFGRPPVLIGHSVGGFVVQRLLETFLAPAAVLMAPIPSSGLGPVRLRYFFRHPIAAIMTQLARSPRWMVRTPRLVRDAFFSSGVPESEVLRYYSYLRPECYRALEDLLHGPKPDPRRVRSPILAVGGDLDTLISRRMVVKTAKTFGADRVLLKGIAHDMMLEPRWTDAADAILQWLDQKQL